MRTKIFNSLVSLCFFLFHSLSLFQLSLCPSFLFSINLSLFSFLFSLPFIFWRLKRLQVSFIFCLLTFFFYLLSEICFLLSSIFCLLSSVFCLVFSIFSVLSYLIFSLFFLSTFFLLISHSLLLFSTFFLLSSLISFHSCLIFLLSNISLPLSLSLPFYTHIFAIVCVASCNANKI